MLIVRVCLFHSCHGLQKYFMADMKMFLQRKFPDLRLM